MTYTDDWLIYQDSLEDLAIQNLLMNEEQIRLLNSEFNYKHYGIFYESMEEGNNDQEGEENKEDNGADEAAKNNLVGFENVISEENLLSKMWQRTQIDPKFGQYYEEWLEDEVWTYYD